MRRWIGYPALVTMLLVGCGGPPPSPQVGGESATQKPPDPTPVLPIPDDAPGADPEAASKVPIKPIPDTEP
jgi:hypothetical protein